MAMARAAVDLRRLRLEKRAIERHGGLKAAWQRSKDMVCSVCLDLVINKENPRERIFGILPNCSHCYCLGCIQTWRSLKTQAENIVKCCPECRTLSHFYISSKYWIVDEVYKQKLIQNHKYYMKRMPCRNFRTGICRLGIKCLYSHDLPEEGLPPRGKPQPSGWYQGELPISEEGNLSPFYRNTMLEGAGPQPLIARSNRLFPRRWNMAEGARPQPWMAGPSRPFPRGRGITEVENITLMRDLFSLWV